MDQVAELWRQGGFVMPWLVGGLLVLWYGLGWRLLTLRRGDRRGLRTLVEEARAGRLSGGGVLPEATRRAVQVAGEPHKHLAQELEYALASLRDELGGYRPMVAIVVILAPLAGLLGTVTGMIETFDSLAEMALFTQGGGVAGGISEALVSTQMGLAVAIPGVIFGRLLDRRQDLLEDELDQLVELVASEGEAA
ncbi:MAG: MotA/TolQ/ExbB proton channel family protein [Deltaproteobacteria bacterium]|nr:MAG: MotA/TolQ/ExbB proton channel family protein [Deltaproteobacteria bacterium]